MPMQTPPCPCNNVPAAPLNDLDIFVADDEYQGGNATSPNMQRASTPGSTVSSPGTNKIRCVCSWSIFVCVFLYACVCCAFVYTCWFCIYGHLSQCALYINTYHKFKTVDQEAQMYTHNANIALFNLPGHL